MMNTEERTARASQGRRAGLRLLRWTCAWMVAAVGSGSLAHAGETILCLGDSITQGSEAADLNPRWWALLGQRLGPETEVVGIGVGSATLSREGELPFLESPAWLDAPAVRADVAIVLLGTNDTVAHGERRPWIEHDRLRADLGHFVTSVRDRCGAPRILLCSPPPMFPGLSGLGPDRRANLERRAERRLLLTEVYRGWAARRPSVDFVDLSRVWSAAHVTDGVHPGPFGNLALAEHLAAVLRTPVDRSPVPLESALADGQIAFRTGYFHGFEQLEFDLPTSGAACRLVRPDFVAAGRPWIWRARFFGHAPGLDLALLERGFHLAYCDVADLYGSGRALERWYEFHDLVSGPIGLAAEPLLYGLSRGGLPVLNYAIGHPERVGAVVLDNPVCDFRTWPGGEGGQHSRADWERLLAAYGLSEAQALGWEHGPLESLAPLAAAKVPLHAVYGTDDLVVPAERNAEILVDRYTRLGGPVTAWPKPGAGHHPHGLEPVAPLVRALLRATGLDDFNPATAPMVSVEARAVPAGWPAGSSWLREVARLRLAATGWGAVEVAFLGDSITQGLTGSAERRSRPGGSRPFDRLTGAVGLGLSGDRTEHLLYRIQNGALAELDPRTIVLQIGVNNLVAGGHTGAEAAAGLAAVVRALREHEPQATVVICGPFPLGATPTDPLRVAVDTIHARAAALAAQPAVEYLDLRSLFLAPDGGLGPAMAPDGIHITALGRGAWVEAVLREIGAQGR